MFHKKSKKSRKPSLRHISLGIPTNIAAGPLGFRAELDIGPEDENGPRASRIVPCDKMGDSQGLPVLGTSIHDVVADTDEHGSDSTEEKTSGPREEEGEPAMTPRVPGEARGERSLGAAATLVNVAEEATDRFGPLKAILGAISATYTDHRETIAIRSKIENLLSHMITLEARFATRPHSVEEQRHRDGLINKFKGIEVPLQSLTKRPGLQQPADLVQDSEAVSKLLGDLQEAINDYKMLQRMTIDNQECKSIDPGQNLFSFDDQHLTWALTVEAAVLNNIHCACEAEYRHGDRAGCLRGTRRAILDKIGLWAQDFDQPPIYWLNGLAGTGKTTIAQTFAERIFADGHLGASFFCSRDFEDRSNLRFIFPTIAVQLARGYTKFRSILVPLVQSDPEIIHESLYGQMNKLIVGPLMKCTISMVIIIDALDECKDEEPASVILSVLGQFASQIPKVKFFITGRPEPQILEGFCHPSLANLSDMFVLHEVESSQVNNDILLFFKSKFSELRGRRLGLSDWPTGEQLDILCKRAAGLFVYAVATVKFINKQNSNPRKQLDLLLQTHENSAHEGKTKFKANKTLDSLYLSILQQAFGDDNPEDDPKIRSVLGAVVLAVNPLSPSTIATLLKLDTEDVLPILSSIHSLLVLHEDINHPIQSFHKSFPDFIVDPSRCINQRFHTPPSNHHMELLISCLELMNQTLEKNMCKLPAGVVNSEVNDLHERTEQYITPALHYSCRLWHQHLIGMESVQMPSITLILHQFLVEKFLFWLEVLSVLGSARNAVDALDVVAKCLDESPTLDLVNDYFRFVLAFFEVISTSAPHIYHSALLLSPQTSLVRALYESYIHPFARVVQGLPISWDPTTVAAKHNHGRVDKAAWSPCSKFIAVAWGAHDVVEIRDGVTLGELKTFECLQKDVLWLSFSPDGRFFTSFSRKQELTCWDLQTGGPAVTIPLGLDLSSGQIFSSTYSASGEMVAIVYEDSDDNTTPTICTYDLLSMTHIYSCHFPGDIIAPIWTYGKCLRFVDVQPGSITIWELGFTSTSTLAEVESLSVPDAFDFSDEVLFLPARSWLAFTIEKTVLIWDTQDLKLLLNFTATDALYGMSFSLHGQFFACVIEGLGACIWKESSNGYMLHRRITWDTSYWTIPLLSPNGESIAMFNSDIVHLCHTTDPFSSYGIPTQSSDHSNFILNFSPDETLAAVARLHESTVTVLDLWSGAPQLIIDTDMEVLGLQVTGSTIAIVSEQKVVIWNLLMEPSASNSRASIEDSVQTVMFDHALLPMDNMAISHDFSCIAVIQDTLRMPGASKGLNIYNISTGKDLTYPVTWGHSPWFSPDGCEVWCIDGPSVKGWTMIKDTESGFTELEPLGRAVDPSGGLPWKSSYGYTITTSGWVLSPTGKLLLWLPPHWRGSMKQDIVWSGQFHGVLHNGLSEAIILDLDG